MATSPIHHQGSSLTAIEAQEGLSGAGSSLTLDSGLEQDVKRFLTLRDQDGRKPGGVVLDHLSVEGSGTGSQPALTLTTSAKSLFGILSPIQNRRRNKLSRPILRDLSLAVNPGEMLLVIGKPGTGCTTLLKTLAGMWDEYKDVQGELSLGGHPISRIISERPQDVVFCDETDSHFPTLTVMETLRFAIRARCPPETSSLDIDEMTTQLAGLVGLSHVLDTKVGDAYIRGVSGGERRRVSLAEALATCASLICLDNPTNGLDSSTALEFTEMMREWTLQSQCVTAMSVYQGSDAILSYFDKVVVMNSGRQVFGGTVPEAVEYFVGLGFEYSPTTTVSDFLSSMSADPDVRRAQEGYEHRVPRTPDELESAFLSSSHFSGLQSCVQLGKAQAEVPWPTNSDRYPIPLYRQAWHCATRQVAIITRDYSSWLVEAACIIVQSLVLGTLFRDQKHSTQSLFIFVSALFYSVLVPALQSMSEFSNTFDQRPLILKHKRYQLYRPIAYSFGLNMTDVVWKIAAITYNIPLYFLTGFQRTAPNFFIWFLAVYVEHLALSMFFRSVAVFSPNMQRAVLPVGIFFNMYVLYTGIYVPVPQMQSWLGWLRYLNPLYYAFESAMVNEFGSLSYDCSSSDLVPSGPAYDTMDNQVCAVFGSEPSEKLLSGMSYLESQYGFAQSHMWRNIGINAVLFVVFALCCGVGMERLKQPAGQMATVFYRGMKSVHQAPTQSKTDGEKGQAADDFPPELTDGLDDIQPSPTRGESSRTLTWNGLSLDIKGKDGGRRLLDNLDGSVRSGKMKALMGVSGAGKTTLLNVLAGRSRVGTLSGEIAIDGQLLPKSFQGRMGYVQQQDVHLPTQTVREALQMTAALRRSDNATIQERYDYVEEVIQWLGMASISEALIGVPGAGLNLEQRKKVSIGVEMAAKPEILLLDEPTSGLDGQSARSIIQLLRRLADSGQAVVCTIHQPAAELIASFDELHLLARGGRLAYDGPLGQDCRLAIEYFEDKARPCAEGENPAEYFLDVIGARSRDGASTDWAGLWKQSDLYRESKTILKERLRGAEARPTPAVSAGSSPYAAPFHLQLRVVLKRAWLYNWRDADYGVSKLWMNVGNALLNSLSYLQSPTTQAGAYNRVFSSFMSMIVGPPLGLQVQPRFVALRDIFLHREKESLAYHWLAFVISAILVELPYAAVTSLVYWLLWYFPVGFFAEPARAGYSLLMYELFAVFATSLAQLCASLMPNLEAAFAANGFLFMFCNTFAGTLSPEPVTPKGWRWYFKLSPLFYLGEGVTANALYDLPLTCEPSEVSVFQPPSGTTCGEYAADFLREATGYLVNPESGSDCQYCRYSDGQSYYIQYGYDFAHRYRNVGIFIGFIAFNFTMVWVMTYLTRIRRR